MYHQIGADAYLVGLLAFCYVPRVGTFSEKEDMPMRFLRDVAAAVLAALIAAMVLRFING